MLWQVVFFILLCAVFLSLQTHALKWPLFDVVKNITGLQSSGPVFTGHLSFISALLTLATVALSLPPLTVRHNEQWSIIQNRYSSICIINPTQENEDSVIKKGPSRHTASLSYNLSYFPSWPDKAKKKGWGQLFCFFKFIYSQVSSWSTSVYDLVSSSGKVANCNKLNTPHLILHLPLRTFFGCSKLVQDFMCELPDPYALNDRFCACV